jgi:hypothetical protein
MRLLGRIPEGTSALRRRNRWELPLRSLGAAAVLAVGMLGLGASPVAIGPFGGAHPFGGANQIGAVADVRAASPSPSADVGGDTRSSGEGPGLVGAPGLAILAVVGLGVLTVLATSLFVRLSGGRRPSD